MSHNKSELKVEFAGYGQWTVILTFTKKRYKLHFTDAQTIDDYNEYKKPSGDMKKSHIAEKRLRFHCLHFGRPQYLVENLAGVNIWKDEE